MTCIASFRQAVRKQNDILDNLLGLPRGRRLPEQPVSLKERSRNIRQVGGAQIVDNRIQLVNILSESRSRIRGSGESNNRHIVGAVRLRIRIIVLNYLAELFGSILHLLNGLTPHTAGVIQDQDCVALGGDKAGIIAIPRRHRRCRQHSQDHAQRQQSA